MVQYRIAASMNAMHISRFTIMHVRTQIWPVTFCSRVSLGRVRECAAQCFPFDLHGFCVLNFNQYKQVEYH